MVLSIMLLKTYNKNENENENEKFNECIYC